MLFKVNGNYYWWLNDFGLDFVNRVSYLCTRNVKAKLVSPPLNIYEYIHFFL